MPMVNQIEIHPLSNKEGMLQYCQNNNIQLVAWSPIMRGRVFSNELIIGLSEKYKKTIAQIILRWHVQRGVIPIPKSSNKERIKENLNIFDFEISNEDMKIINSLNEGDSVSVSGVPDNTTYLKYQLISENIYLNQVDVFLMMIILQTIILIFHSFFKIIEHIIIFELTL